MSTSFDFIFHSFVSLKLVFTLMNSSWAYSFYKNPTCSSRVKNVCYFGDYGTLLSHLILIFLSFTNLISRVLLLFLWNY